jgi:hypothetical protein
MKKYMIADMMKDITSDLIAKAKEEFDLNDANAEIFVNDYPNEADWPQVANAADALNLDIMDISPDDVENINSAGSAKGSIDTSMGIVKYIYDHKLQTYTILLLLDRELVYKNITPDMMNDMINADSFGSYYNDELRENEDYEGCGCNDNLCEVTDTVIFSSIS